MYAQHYVMTVLSSIVIRVSSHNKLSIKWVFGKVVVWGVLFDKDYGL